jgi:hypothetical protein
MQRQTKLPQIVQAFDPTCGLAGSLHGGQEQAHEDADDGQDDY